MYAVVRYYNYRKEIGLGIIKIFTDLNKAARYAYECAVDHYEGEERVTVGVSEKWLDLDEAIEGYTTGDGYGAFVFTVIRIPE